MNIVTLIALLASHQGAASGGGGGSTPPAGEPTGVNLTGGSPVTVNWTNGDPTSLIELGKSSMRGTEPSAVAASLAAGTTSYNTGENGTISSSVELGTFWWVRHVEAGVRTDWVASAEGYT